MRQRQAPSADASERMRRVRRRDTTPEIAIRRELHRRGLRFRIDYKIPAVRTRPDIAFVGRRTAIFVDGCFWHGCPEHGTLPKSNRAWWAEKLQANQERDRRSDRALADLGWKVLRFWEHDSASGVADMVEESLKPPADNRITTCPPKRAR